MAIGSGLARQFCAVGLALLSGCASGGPVCKPEPIALVQIHFIHGEPVFDATMNGKTVQMMFDTGAEVSLITPQTVARLHIPVFYNHTMMVFGAGGSVGTSDAVVKQFQMGVAVGTTFKFPVVSLANRHVPELARIGGLIGEDVFHNYDVDIDFPHNQALLIDTRHCHTVIPWSSALHPVRFHTAPNGSAEFPISLNSHRVEAIFDTGAGGLAMSRSEFNALGLNADHPQKIAEIHGLGVGGPAFGITVYRLRDATVGGVAWHHPIVDVGGQIGEIGSFVLIGENFIRDHEIYISFSRRMLYVRAARS